MAVLWCGLVSLGMAEDKKANQSPDDKNAETRTDTAANATLRAEIHRTMAALIEAQAAEKPDQAKIGELTKKLQQLRAKLWAPSAVGAGNPSAGWVCPGGGPGMGWGRGAGWGGPGRGPGMGRGAGFGPGAGRGWGGGRGFGPGAGQGLAPGGGVFVDEDQDGICDTFELRHGMHNQ
jgi:hypothetical protein